MIKHFVVVILRTLLLPVARLVPLHKWNYLLSRVFEIKVYGKEKGNTTESASGSANINILIDLFDKTNNINGSVAECGVFRGATFTYLAYYIRYKGLQKKLYGFDSFEGFDKNELVEEKTGGYSSEMEHESALFQKTSKELVENKLRLVKATENVLLIKGFFEDTLKIYNTETYSFVHLDCDLYEAYKTCLEYFYPRLAIGGIILFDEYNDPVYTKCTKTIDDFFRTKSESITAIKSDNQIKYYIEKQ